MAWILAAREEPESLDAYVLRHYPVRLTASMLIDAAAAYDPDWLPAGVIESDGTGSAHWTGRYRDPLGEIRAARTQLSADAVDPETGEPLLELWLDVVGFGDRLADAIRAGRSARSINLTLEQQYRDGETGPYIGHLAVLTLGEQPRIPGMAPLDAALFEGGIEPERGRLDQIAASIEAADTGRSITRRLQPPTLEGDTMPDEKRDEERDDEEAGATATDAKPDKKKDDDETAVKASRIDSAAIETAARAAVNAALERQPKQLDATTMAKAIGASVAEAMKPIASAVEGLRADLDQERAGRRADLRKASARELAASLPPALQDKAIEHLASIEDDEKRNAAGELFASMAGLNAPVNLDELRIDGDRKLDSIHIEAAAADLGVPLDQLNAAAVRDSVMTLARSKADADAARKPKEVN